MSREIKFRAWDKAAHKMRGVLGLQDLFTIRSDGQYHEDYKVMQFTGLKDKNDVDIFEGDIIRWGLGFTDYDTENWHRYAVVEINPDIQFKIVYYVDSNTNKKMPTDNHIFQYARFAYDTERHVEVIGNRFENPELL